MFGWLRYWLGWESRPAEAGVYAPKDRLIYHYCNGERVVAADPSVLYRRLMDIGPELNADIALAGSPSKAARDAVGKAEWKLRQLFELKPFSEGGLGEVEAYELLDHFLGYCTSVKKNLAKLPIYCKNTPAIPSAAEATSSSSASGSTASEPSTAAPEPLPTVSKSPLASTPVMNTGTP